MEERKFVCKYCNKRFPCGKSLGGHIRTHMTEERCNVDSDMLNLDASRKNKSQDVVGDTTYGLRENPKKTMRFVHSNGGGAGGSTSEHQEKLCKECGKGFPSLKALCGHMASHSEKEKKLKLVLDSYSDTGTCASTPPRRSKRMRFKTLNFSNHHSSFSSVVPLANGSSPLSEVEQEQEEVARCLILLSKDSSFKDRFASVAESSKNNSVILETKSSSLVWSGISNGGKNFVSSNAYDFVEKKLLSDVKLKSSESGASDNSDSRCFRYGLKAKMVDSHVSNGEFKGPKMGGKSKFFEDYDVESRKMMNTGRSKCSVRDSDSLGHNLVGVSSKKIANGFANDEVYENGREGWEYEWLEGERENGSYDSIYEIDENSSDSETDSFPAPKKSHSSKAINGNKSNKAKKKLKCTKGKEHECPICFRIFKSGQALGGHKRSHFIGRSVENSLVIKHVTSVVPCLIDLNLPAPVDQ
ncbi:hypothetical protein RJT34_02594 [Clitoria ternatea]|uniref:C2H2-type domain-containing protein n=1 Tax=Clitoria ternatea TaxID=43366 RepID=A0AAN9KKL2_CLITE